MMTNLIRKHLKRNDDGISPVIGTILMVAATVIIGGAVYASVNAYSGKSAKATTDAAFKAQSIDTDGDGLEDTIKVTYLSGPADLANATVQLSVRNAAGAAAAADVYAHATEAKWNAGDYRTFDEPAGSFFVSVAVSETTVLDQSLTLRE